MTEFAPYGLDCIGADAASDELLPAADDWLDCHEKIGALLGLPPPSHVAHVRAALRMPINR